MTKRKYGLAWTAVATLLLGSTSRAQQPSAPATTFKVDVNHAEVDAVVTDRRGAFVRDRRKEDFSITETGRAQQLWLIASSIWSMPR